MEHCRAILVRRVRWSETSLIVTWMTDHFGTVQTLARGALRPKSGFAGKLDIFHRAEISFSPSRRSTLHTLHEVVLQGIPQAFPYKRLVLASYFAELAASASPTMQPAHDVWDLLHRALEHLAGVDVSLRALPHFECELAKILGVWHEDAGIAPHAAIAGLFGGVLPRTRGEAVAAGG